MDYTVRRIDPGSVFKIAFVLYGLIGLVIGFVYALMFFFVGAMGSHAFGPGMGNIFRIGSGVGGIVVFFLGIVFAFFYALFASAITTLGAVVYNLLAASVGGLKVTLAAQGPAGQAPSAPGQPYTAAAGYPPPPQQAPAPPPYQPFPPAAPAPPPAAPAPPPATSEPPAAPPPPQPPEPPRRSPYAPPEEPEDQGTELRP
jgi:hypothetical protein